MVLIANSANLVPIAEFEKNLPSAVSFANSPYRTPFRNRSCYAINRINPLYNESESSGYNSSTGNSSNETANNSDSIEIISKISQLLQTVFDEKCNKSDDQVLLELSKLLFVEFQRRRTNVPFHLNEHDCESASHRKSFIFPENNKLSYWQIYYDSKNRLQMANDCTFNDNFLLQKRSSLSEICRGRPEADFTLDFSEMETLKQKMKLEKKWRCRCRIIVSLVGLVFFILSLIAVSLTLTRGKRIFGSMI